MSQTLIAAEPLQAFTQEIFTRVGFEPQDAATQAEVLVWANLRGVDSHGVLRIPWYVELVETGLMQPRPKLQVLVETAAAMLVDVDHGPGPVVTKKLMTQTMVKAREAGIAWTFIRNTTHQGALGYYSAMAAQAGMAGLAVVCSPPNMAWPGAKAAGTHNSPISIAVPAGKQGRVVLDMATSVAAGGKLQLARDKDIPIPTGWALDKQGNPTTDSKQATILLPAGGPKGSGLAFMFECLSSLMVGNPLLAPMLSGRETSRRHRQNGFLAAIDVARFTDLGQYRAHVDETVEGLKALPKNEGVAELYAPGEPEDRVAAERSAKGIPVPAGTISRIQKVAERLGVRMPF